jgi:hypothetical protein
MEDMKDLLDMQFIEKSTDGAQELKSPLGQFTNAVDDAVAPSSTESSSCRVNTLTPR